MMNIIKLTFINERATVSWNKQCILSIRIYTESVELNFGMCWFLNVIPKTKPLKLHDRYVFKLANILNGFLHMYASVLTPPPPFMHWTGPPLPLLHVYILYGRPLDHSHLTKLLLTISSFDETALDHFLIWNTVLLTISFDELLLLTPCQYFSHLRIH